MKKIIQFMASFSKKKCDCRFGIEDNTGLLNENRNFNSQGSFTETYMDSASNELTCIKIPSKVKFSVSKGNDEASFGSNVNNANIQLNKELLGINKGGSFSVDINDQSTDIDSSIEATGFIKLLANSSNVYNKVTDDLINKSILVIDESTVGADKGNVYRYTGNISRLKSYTVATLPASPTQGDEAAVTDATSPTYLGALTGGGSTYTPVIFNGTIWISH